MGVLSLTVIVKVVAEGEAFVGTKPEKNPPARGWHGSSKLDWVTLWFCRAVSVHEVISLYKLHACG